MQLYLSGGGGPTQSFKLDQQFSNALSPPKKILYIPIAMDKIKHPYPECFEWLCKSLNPHGITQIEMWTEEELRKKTEPELKNFSGVYIGGGNTYYLLQELKESGFSQKLHYFLKKNIPIYGGSAGAIIFGTNIITCGDENAVQLKDLNGLDQVNGYAIFCHYDPKSKSDCIQIMKENNLTKAIALPEGTGIIVNNSIITVVGDKPATVFDQDVKEYLPNSIIR